uniref:Potassium two pore domain channel subfamily K member 17 n=1 Tax=Athene cunicularia TaxID=194338 RepID=A0A663LN05_ATHCN
MCPQPSGVCNPMTFFARSNFSVLTAIYGFLFHESTSMGTGYSLLKREATEQHWKCQLHEFAIRGFVGSHFIVSLQGIIQAYKSGITLQGNSTSLGRWDFSGSFFFSISAITTIGYGNLSPSTAAGRIFCILFALFGIPLNLVLLNEIGQLMLLGVQHCAHRLERFDSPTRSFLLIKTCALVTGLLLFLLLPPLLFFDKEGWSYEEGFYYSFITLSTIGFGDYVIGMNPDRTYPGWYKNVISLWILFGMAWLALIIKFCPTEFDSCCHLYIHIEPSHFLIAVVLLAS